MTGGRVAVALRRRGGGGALGTAISCLLVDWAPAQKGAAGTCGIVSRCAGRGGAGGGRHAAR